MCFKTCCQHNYITNNITLKVIHTEVNKTFGLVFLKDKFKSKFFPKVIIRTYKLQVNVQLSNLKPLNRKIRTKLFKVHTYNQGGKMLQLLLLF